MGILDEFDPTRDGWFFDNWDQTTPFDWDLYRRTYLAINPTDDVAEAPLDVAFYQIFKNCASNGHCGGLSMLALALYKYGGYMGFCSPASFYTGDPTGNTGPDRTDLAQAISIMQGRQFSAPGIQNFVDMVKAGQLNDGVAAWSRFQSGLGSGDYCMLSLATGLIGEAAHTIVPYRADMSGSDYVLHVWDCDRPYNSYPEYYDGDHNKIVITGPTDWTYDQNAGGIYTDGTVYSGSENGWFFAIPISLEVHKGPQPISAGFALTGGMMLLFSAGAAVTQIEDDQGRRLYTSDRLHRSRGDLETTPDRRLPGVAPWPWRGRHATGLPGELFFLQRPPGSSPLTVSVRGDEYRLMQLSSQHVTEVTARDAGAGAKDRVRLTGSPGEDQAVVVSTRALRRRFDIHHLRQYSPGAWRSVRLHNGLVTNDQLRVGAPRAFDAVEISGITSRRDIEVELRRYDGNKIARRTLTHSVPAGKTLRIAPTEWNRLSRAMIEQILE
jgi:hypothetical protein